MAALPVPSVAGVIDPYLARTPHALEVGAGSPLWGSFLPTDTGLSRVTLPGKAQGLLSSPSRGH